MEVPKQYKAMTLPGSGVFGEIPSREVIGYYVKHVYATPYPISTEQEYADFVANHTKHYIMTNGFSDWGLRREMEFFEIDISTLEEL